MTKRRFALPWRILSPAISQMLGAVLLSSLMLQVAEAKSPHKTPTRSNLRKHIKIPNATIALPPPAPVQDSAPPYQAQLLRLSQLIGTLTYMRQVCGDHDSADWRAKMTAIIDADAASPDRKQQLIAAYNRGFGGYALTYRNCTDNARVVIARALDESAQLSADISSHYGGT